MSSGSDRERELISFYEEQQLREDLLGELLSELASNDPPGHVPNKTAKKRFGAVVAIAIAASVTLLCGVAICLAFSGTRQKPIAGDKTQSRDRVAENAAKTSLPRFRFVAIRSHDDGCPHCRATGEMFASLEQRFRGQPIEFEQLELQKKVQAVATMRRADELRLTGLINGRMETAFGILLSEDATQLVRFTPADGDGINHQRLRDVIDQ